MKLRINVKRKKEDCLRVEFGSKNQRETIDSHFFNYMFSIRNSEKVGIVNGFYQKIVSFE